MSDKLGIVGRKIGMTRIFTEDGVSVPAISSKSAPTSVSWTSLIRPTRRLTLS